MKTKFLFLLVFVFVCCTSAMAQLTVRGTVVSDTDAEPLIGVAILEQGTGNGTITDADGQFELTLKNNKASLLISYVGYITQQIAVNGRQQLNVRLVEDSKLLEDVVVVGYGVQRKSDVTGAIASVRSEDLQNRSTSDAASALMGKAAGVQILNASGAPGDGGQIRVRGYSSNSGNIGPLIIVDGLKVSDISYLDPEMIESMEILKDAASAAIYGAQAGNGVVLITTKSGKKGNGKIFYNNQFSLNSLSRDLKIMNAKQYIQFGKEFGWLSDQSLQDAGYNGCDTNWGDEVFTPTWTQRHTVGVQGGNDKGHYFLSLNNIDYNGIFKGDKDVFKRLTLQVNADYKIKNWLQVGTNTSIEKRSSKSISQHSDNGSAMLAAVTSSPLFPVMVDESGLTPYMKQALADGKRVLQADKPGYYWSLPLLGETQGGNPFIRRDASEDSSSGINVRGTVFANITPVKDVTFTSRFGYRINQGNSHSYSAPYEASATINATKYNISATASTSYYYQWENFANYNHTFAKKHNVNAMVGMSYTENNSDNVTASANGTDILSGYEPNFRYLNYVLSNDKTTKTISNAPGQSTNISYFGRLGYAFSDRYNVQFNFRADAFDSSKLDKDARWGYFPSVSAGWTISNEKFFKDNVNRDLISNVKLRASYGVNGNVNVLNNYQYATTISYNGQWYQYDPDSKDLTYGSMPSGLANPKLTWETSKQLDLGLDFRMFKDRLAVGLDYYNKKTDDLLITINPSAMVGIASTIVNAGAVENSGLELELSWKDRIGDFAYSVTGNVSTLKNKVTYLDSSVPRIIGTQPQGVKLYTAFEQGATVWYMRGYKAEGVDPKTGEGIYKDINGDNIIDDNDLTDVGSGIPTMTFGLTLNMAYKNFDFTVFGTGVAGNKIFPSAFRIDRPSCNAYSYYFENRWTPEHTNAKVPALSTWDQTFLSSTLNVFDGSYFKIKQIQLGYTVPKSLLKKVSVESLRVFTSLDNFFTFSSYPGLDPETAQTTASSALGVDMGSYPTSKSFIFGINLSF